MDDILKPFENQILEIASLAKRLNYNMDSDLKPLLKIWLEEGRKFMVFVEDNKEDFVRVQKQFIK